MNTDTHPEIIGAEIKAIRENLGFSSVEMMHLLGYSSGNRELLRQRMHEFETAVKPLPPAQTRLLLLLSYVILDDEADLENLRNHGDFMLEGNNFTNWSE